MLTLSISNILKLSLQLLLITEVSSFAFPMPLKQYKTNNRQLSKCLCHMSYDRRHALVKGLLLANIPQIVQAYNQDELQHMQIYDKCAPSVCYISTEYRNIAEELKMPPKDTKNLPKGVGTGFVWDIDGHIVTNFHVINKVDKAEVSITDAKGNSHKYLAKLTGVDPDRDIAVLKIDNTFEFKPISIGSIDEVKIGQYAYAIGNPFGQDHTFTMGIISGKNREITSPTGKKIKGMIQTDAAINPGNSGGPLLDSSARLIGMNTATFGMGVSSGVNFAISIDMIKETVSEIIKYGVVQRAVLGISYIEKLPDEFPTKIEKGVIVLQVPETSPAFAAGLLGIDKQNKSIGDVIVGIDENTINNPSDMLTVLEKYKPGNKVKLHVLRGNKIPMILDIVLSSFRIHTFAGLEYEKEPSGASIPLDVPLDNISPQIKPSMK